MRLNGNLDVSGTIAGFEGGATLKVKQVTSTTTQTASSDTAVTAFTAITFPSTPDGVKVFAVTVSLMMEQDTDGGPKIRLRMGTSGDVTDALQFQGGTGIESNQAQSTPSHIGRFQVTPAASETITISILPSAGSWELNANTGDRSNVIIEQIS